MTARNTEAIAARAAMVPSLLVSPTWVRRPPSSQSCHVRSVQQPGKAQQTTIGHAFLEGGLKKQQSLVLRRYLGAQAVLLKKLPGAQRAAPRVHQQPVAARAQHVADLRHARRRQVRAHAGRQAGAQRRRAQPRAPQ